MNFPQTLSEHQSCEEKNTHTHSDVWQALLQLCFEQKTSVKPGQTVLGKTQHYGPLRVQRPFYPEGTLAHIYILHPPGGVVGGDQLTIHFTLQKNTQVLSTTPGSGKFYLSSGKTARLSQHLVIKPGASLEWLPQENILFSGARLHARTRIECQGDATFIGWDITCLGRPGCDEQFKQGSFDARLAFYHDDKLLFIENMRVSNENSLRAQAGLRGYPLQASLLAFPCDQAMLISVRHQLEQLNSTLIAATLIDGLLVVRVLGDNSERIKQQLTQIWQVLRPAMLKRFAVIPRIWAT